VGGKGWHFVVDHKKSLPGLYGGLVMDNNYFKVCYSIADPDELKTELIKRYGFKKSIECYVFKRSINDIYQVKMDDIIYYLRIASNDIRFANNGTTRLNMIDYQEEANIMVSLNKNGVNTAIPVRCKDNSFVWPINAPEGIRYAILFTEAKNNPSDNKIKLNYNIGQALANIHKISDEQNYIVSRAPIDFTQSIEKVLALLKPFLDKKEPGEYEFIANAANEIKAYITERLITEKPYYGFCHGDVGGNVFFNGEIPTFFDFDFMGYGWRIDDISYFVWDNLIENPQYKKSEDYIAYIDGYNAVRQLSKNEMECMDAFGALRALWIMGSAILGLYKKGERLALEGLINHMVKYI
jgi:Ser/Thr protein kinase RdoA (MazF antagonist)